MKTCFWTKEEKTVYLSGSHISEVEVMRRDIQCIRTLSSQEYLQNDYYSLPETMWKRRYFILPSFSLVVFKWFYYRIFPRKSLYPLSDNLFVLMKTDTYLSPYSYLHLPSCLSVVAINLLNKLYYGMFRQKYYSKC